VCIAVSKISVLGVLILHSLCHHWDPWKTLPCTKPHHTSHCAWKSVQLFCCRRWQGMGGRCKKSQYR